MPLAALWRAWPVRVGQRRSSRPGAPVTGWLLRWVTCGVAAVSVALLVGGIVLSYADRRIGSGGRWDFSDVFEEATFVAVPLVGFILTSRRPGNRVGWIFLGAGLVVGLGFFCDRYGRGAGARPRGSWPRRSRWLRSRGWYAPATSGRTRSLRQVAGGPRARIPRSSSWSLPPCWPAPPRWQSGSPGHRGRSGCS
jgi:hypothetical protein